MLSQFAELYRRLVESAQDYASDAALASVTGEADTQGLRHEDLDGDFQLMLKFNPANMNHKDLIDRVTALGQVIAPLDAKNEIDRGPVVRNAFLQLFPECQGASFKSSEEIIGDDLKDEEQNFVKIKAGMDAAGEPGRDRGDVSGVAGHLPALDTGAAADGYAVRRERRNRQDRRARRFRRGMKSVKLKV